MTIEKAKGFGGLALLLIFVGMALPATAETIRLKDGRTIAGDIVHSYRGIFSISTPGGLETVGKNEIASIEFDAAPPSIPDAKPNEPAGPSESEPNFLNAIARPDSPYATPSATFETWRKAALAGDIDEMVDAYASFRRGDVRKQLRRLKKREREEMQATTAQTQFVAGQPIYQGDRAVLEITWNKGLYSDTQVLNFVLEGNDWKIVQ